MKLGVFTALFSQQKLEQALDYVAKQGLDCVEIGTGNYPGAAHCPLEKLVLDKKARDHWLSAFKARKLSISALSCHGNPVHPDKKFAQKDRKVFELTCKLAKLTGVEVVVNFSGCPGSDPGAKYPNWVTCPWPNDFQAVLDYQWNKIAIPYWKQASKMAANQGVKIALEMHPGFIVYNPETLLRLRSHCGKNIGANFDPSHLFWQGIDPIEAVRLLKDCLYHVHAKDTRIDESNTKKNGVLDTKSYGDIFHRSWVFRTVGFGHGELFWRDFISTLGLVKYDGAISIEHEDGLLSVNEGFTKAVSFLKGVIRREKPGDMWWA